MSEQTPLGKTEVSMEPIVGSFEQWLSNDESEKLGPLVKPADPKPTDAPPAEAAPADLLPEPPPTEAAPETPAPEATEAAPPEAPETDEVEDTTPQADGKPRKRPSWKQVHELERERDQERSMRLRTEQERADHAQRMSQLEAELARMRGFLEGKGDIPAESTQVIEDDPLTKLETKVQTLEQQGQQAEQHRYAMQVEQTIRAQEAQVEAKHPEYKEALNHLIKSEVEEWRIEGVINDFASKILQGNPQGVRQMAAQSGKSERETAETLATQALLQARRDRMVTAALSEGANVAERVLALAERRGFKRPGTTGAATPAAPAPATPKKDPVAVREASQSLSAVPHTAAPPAKKTITSRAELMALEGEQLERYILENDAKDPGWERRLA
jgi:hypothetical protein